MVLLAVLFGGTLAKRRSDADDGPWVSVLFQNITEWEAKAEVALTSTRCNDEVIMLAEHRLRGEQGKRTLDGHARRQGWKALASPARLKKVEATGGEAILFKQHLAVHAHAPQLEALPSMGKGVCNGIMADWWQSVVACIGLCPQLDSRRGEDHSKSSGCEDPSHAAACLDWG